MLLLEAGGGNASTSYLVPGDRFTLAFKEPSLNWGFKTEPQTHLKGQQIDYSRGKGLGGSSAINFSCWVIGADEDFEEWARKTGDEDWSWEKVKERLKKIESYHVGIPDEHRGFINPKAEDHGTNGPLHLSYADLWEKGLTDVFVAAQEMGMGVNPDVNSGNPIGMGMGAACMHKGLRTTSSAYLKDASNNLTVMPNSPVAKVVLSQKKAIGVKTIDGRDFYAKRDVILSAGALQSPQLLMLSGIGPAEELKTHNIPLIHNLPEVGKNLQDHCFSTVTLLQKPGTNDRMAFETNAEAVTAARAQHEKYKTGLMSSLYCGTPMGWFKNEAVMQSAEYKALNKYTREHLKKPTIPIYEIATVSLPRAAGTSTDILSSTYRPSLQATTSFSLQTATSRLWLSS